MTIENGIRVLAGSMVLIGVGLAHWVHPGWLFLPVFVGVNLIQSAFTGFCPAALIMKACGMPPCNTPTPMGHETHEAKRQ